MGEECRNCSPSSPLIRSALRLARVPGLLPTPRTLLTIPEKYTVHGTIHIRCGPNQNRNIVRVLCINRCNSSIRLSESLQSIKRISGLEYHRLCLKLESRQVNLKFGNWWHYRRGRYPVGTRDGSWDGNTGDDQSGLHLRSVRLPYPTVEFSQSEENYQWPVN